MERIIRLLLIASEPAPGMIPYAATLINLLSGLRGFEVYILVVERQGASFLSHLSEKAKVKTTVVEAPVNKLSKLIGKVYPKKLITDYESLVRKHDIHFIHYLTNEFTLSLYDLIHPRRTQPVLYTVHDLTPHEREKTSPIRELFFHYINWACKRHIRGKEILTTSSYEQYAELKRNYPEKQIFHTPFPPLITESIENGTDPVPELSDIHDYYLFFGTVDKYKGVALLMEAFGKMRKEIDVKWSEVKETKSNEKEGNEKEIIGLEGKECKAKEKVNKEILVIAGKGSDYSENTPTEGIVRINRFIEDNEIASLFKNARAVVCPYRSVTMSGLPSLARYFSKPLIAADLPFFREQADTHTRLFKVGDSRSLQQCLEEILPAPVLPITKNDELLAKEKETLKNRYAHLYKMLDER